MRIMGIDLGEKRVGIAVSDELKMTAQGVDVIKRKDFNHPERVKELCKQYQVIEIVLGYPLTMKGTSGVAAQEAEKIQKKLQNETGLPVYLWDERLTSVSAERVLFEADISRKSRQEVKDKLAAVFILESFLERRNK